MGEILKHEKNNEKLCDCVAFQCFAFHELCGIRSYPDDLRDFSGLFSGVLYERYDYLNLRYYRNYKDGLLDGVEVEFYSSGKIKNYCVWNKSRLVGKFYEWYKNGKIKKYVDRDQNKRFEFDEQGNITKQTD